MLGNLGVTARASRGAYVWLLGDDDLLTDGAIENVLEGLAAYPDVEMAYMNYAYTHVDDPGVGDIAHLLADATPIGAAARTATFPSFARSRGSTRTCSRLSTRARSVATTPFAPTSPIREATRSARSRPASRHRFTRWLRSRTDLRGGSGSPRWW